jgi:hypothetical protein
MQIVMNQLSNPFRLVALGCAKMDASMHSTSSRVVCICLRYIYLASRFLARLNAVQRQAPGIDAVSTATYNRSEHLEAVALGSLVATPGPINMESDSVGAA